MRETYTKLWRLRKDGRTTHRIFLTAEIEKKEGLNYETLQLGEFLALSITGNLYEVHKTKPVWIAGGQIDSTIKQLLADGHKIKDDAWKLEEALRIWDEWHLNNFTPGTKRQMEALEEPLDYDSAVKRLKEIGLYDNNGYKYGQAWLIKPLPDEVIARLKVIFT